MFYRKIFKIITFALLGAGTFIKLLPSITVISRISNYKIGWRDYVGWSISFISSVYLLQEPNIYRNDKVEWQKLKYKQYFILSLNNTFAGYGRMETHFFLD